MAIGGRNGTARRVGELAKASGLTVRTLHYYEEVGLLVPSVRSDAGHRLYVDADVARLYRHAAGPARPPGDVDRRHRQPLTGDLLEVLEEMTMLDTTVQRRISILVCTPTWKRPTSTSSGCSDSADQPYGYREYSGRDNEGGLWSFMKPLD